MLHIKNAKYIKNKLLNIEFIEYSGDHLVDLQEYINTKPFKLLKELNNENNFKDFKLDHGVICWRNGFDIAPEYLFFLIHKNNSEYHNLFLEWGYLDN